MVLIFGIRRKINRQWLFLYNRDKNDLKILRNAIEKRLRMNTDHVYAGRWTEALGLMALPSNVASSLRLLSELVNDMWYLAGDTSVDVSFC